MKHFVKVVSKILNASQRFISLYADLSFLKREPIFIKLQFKFIWNGRYRKKVTDLFVAIRIWRLRGRLCSIAMSRSVAESCLCGNLRCALQNLALFCDLAGL